MDKKDLVYTRISHKKCNLAISNFINGPCRQYAKRNKSDRERQILHDLTYMWNLKTKQNTQEKSKCIDRENRLVASRDGAWANG